uniref:Alpha-acetolactate decarboxylase n=1 Tax=Chlorobium phaeobacteroides (strain BS1) TaxID=331678 RepID=B3EJ86_CHLPB
MNSENPFVHFLHNLHLHRNQPHGRHASIEEHDHHGAYEIFQVSTVNALIEGLYDGEISYGELRKHGDFGIGTFNALDGEMIAFDGKFFQIKGDGNVNTVSDDQKTPFAVVQFFKPNLSVEITEEKTFEELTRQCDALLQGKNCFYTIRVNGFFKSMKTRSVHRQHRPYKPLNEITRTQMEFEFTDIEGTIAGFCFPDFTKGLNVPGYHLHFLSHDRKSGGHILDCTMNSGKLSIDHTSNFHMELPQNKEFLEADLGKDTRKAVDEAEK